MKELPKTRTGKFDKKALRSEAQPLIVTGGDNAEVHMKKFTT